MDLTRNESLLLEAARGAEQVAGRPGPLNLAAIWAGLDSDQADEAAASLVLKGMAELLPPAPVEVGVRIHARSEVEILQRHVADLETKLAWVRTLLDLARGFQWDSPASVRAGAREVITVVSSTDGEDHGAWVCCLWRSISSPLYLQEDGGWKHQYHAWPSLDDLFAELGRQDLLPRKDVP